MGLTASARNSVPGKSLGIYPERKVFHLEFRAFRQGFPETGLGIERRTLAPCPHASSSATLSS